MHELGICRSLIDVALGAMSERGAVGPATAVNVEIGRFTSVVPDALRFYFEILSRGTALEGADLAIASIPLRTRCRTCGNECEPEAPVLLCDRCEGLVDIVSGRELRLVSLDVAEAVA